MMKHILLSGFFLAACLVLLSVDIPAGENFIPSIGRFLNPYDGVWQNAKAGRSITTLKGPLANDVKILFDDRDVPHIYAQSVEEALYAQGYLHAANRLFQMDISTRAAAGRLSELVGARALAHDHQQRERGIEKIAQQKAATWEKENASTINAYVAGVNDFIHSLDYADWPIEYKILSHSPVEWTPTHSALMATNMAIMLCMAEKDLDYTKAKAALSEEKFRYLYPDHNKLESPIIPAEKKWDFTPIGISDSIANFESGHHLPTDDNKDDDINGSNNWAINAAKSKNGFPLLANDPHLSLTLPSIWYEIEIHTPDMHVHGVSIPGLPYVIIGFNENIAWGTTNSGQDVLDWYKIEWKDSSRTTYMLDDKIVQAELRIETINIRGQKSITDTVRYTQWGPVTSRGEYKDMAMKWIAHSRAMANDIDYLVRLNRGKDVNDYRKSMEAFQYPAQNKVFASTGGDIAITVAGVMPLRGKGQGAFIMDGNSSANDWKGFIPFTHAPFIINPKQGYVSSANQAPVDTTYGYPLLGTRIFEDYRGRVINRVLDSSDQLTVQDMKALQQNDYNLHATEILPLLFASVDSAECLSAEETGILRKLKGWNFMHHRDSISAIYYEIWYDEFERMMFDELDTLKIMHPEDWRIIEMIIDTSHAYFDLISTSDKKETLKDIACASFTSMVKTYLALDEKDRANWGAYKKAEIPHLARMGPFGVPFMHTSGAKHIVNAMGKSHGPSWRMIVEMTSPPRAYVNYPGGQSGDPASPHYADMLQEFFEGKYYEVQLHNDPDSWSPARELTITAR